MNLPNFLTFFRMALGIALMVVLFHGGIAFNIAALVIFIIASITDYWDGEIARRSGQVTSLGRLMDPIADKILTLSAFLAFVQLDIIPAWIVMIIMLRDFLITGLRLLMPKDAKDLAARQSGKHKTVLQFSAIIGVLIFLIAKETSYWKLAWTPTALSVIGYGMIFIMAITLWSGIRYVYLNRRYLWV